MTAHMDEVRFSKIEDRFQWFMASRREGKNIEICHKNLSAIISKSSALFTVISLEDPKGKKRTDAENVNSKVSGPPQPKRSYVEITRDTHIVSNFTHFYPQLPPVNIDGTPKITFTDDEVNELSTPFENTFIGKFSRPIPNLMDIREEIKRIRNINREVFMGAIDYKYVIIRF